MREIKFRGIRKDNGKWIYGYPYHKIGCSIPNQILEQGNYFENDMGMECGHVEPVVPESISQYTGLKDKNGKEIYEGDILNCWGGENYQGCWEYTETIVLDNMMDTDKMNTLSNIEFIEVMGNVYGNEVAK